MAGHRAAYFRCSTDRQETSIAMQRAAYMARHGAAPAVEFIDEGVRGTGIEPREAFLGMLAEAQRPDRRFDEVWFFDLSRFSREEADAFFFAIKTLERAGVAIKTLNGEAPTGEYRDLMFLVEQMKARGESRTFARRTLAGKAEKTRDGRFTGSTAPYGYRLGRDGERPVLVPGPDHEAATVRRIYDLFERGQGIRAIAKTLNGEGVPSPRGTCWRDATVLGILRNPAYGGFTFYGRRTCKGAQFYQLGDAGQPEAIPPTGRRGRTRKRPAVLAEGSHPAIVERGLWTRVQERFKFRPVNQHIERGVALLGAGKLKCAHCGASLIHQDGVYACDRAFRHGIEACPRGGRVSAEAIDGAVLEELRKLYADPVRIASVRRKVREKLKGLVRAGKERGKLETEAKAKDEAVRRATARFMAVPESAMDAARDELERLTRERDAARARLEALPPDMDLDRATDEAVAGFVALAADLAEDAAREARRRAIQALVTRIEVEFEPRTKPRERWRVREARGKCLFNPNARELTGLNAQS